MTIIVNKITIIQDFKDVWIIILCQSVKLEAVVLVITQTEEISWCEGVLSGAFNISEVIMRLLPFRKFGKWSVYTLASFSKVWSGMRCKYMRVVKGLT